MKASRSLAGRVETVRMRYLPWQRDVRARCLDALRDYGDGRRSQKTLVLANAARTGKDRVSAMCVVEMAERLGVMRAAMGVHLVPRVNVWVVGPTVAMLRQNWDELMEFVPQRLVVRQSREDGEVRLRGDVVFRFKSADRPENLVAEGVDILWMTEASRVKSNVAWEESLLPRLVSPGRLGLALLNGTPRVPRSHWFRKAFDRAAKELRWNLPITANPLITNEDIGKLQEQLHRAAFKAEVLGQWPDEDDVKPFRSVDVDKLFVSDGPIPVAPFVVAVDVARVKDETVATAWDRLGQVVGILRMRGRKVQEQVKRIAEFWGRWPGTLIWDTTSSGGAIFGDLLREAISGRVVGYDFHGARKVDLFDALVVAVEGARFTIRQDMMSDGDAKELRWQLEHFEREFTDTVLGVDYHGPGGDRDDAVVSLGLGWHLTGPLLKRSGNAAWFDEIVKHGW